MSNKNVLFLSYDGLTDQLGQSQIMPYIIGLSKQGFNFSIISFEKSEGLYSKKYVQDILDQEGIAWYPLPYTKKPPVLSTLFDYFRLQKLTFKLVKEKNIDLVHCRSYITALVGLLVKRKLKKKFLFDMRGLWADERVDGGLWNLNNPLFNLIYKFFKSKEMSFFQEADRSISLTEAGKKEINSWFDKKNEPQITTIPCAVDLEIFDGSKITEDHSKNIRSQLKIRDKKVVIYLGSLGTWYLLDEMLDFFKVLNQSGDWCFLFLTRDRDVLDKALVRHQISQEEVRVVEAQRKDVPSYLSICNAGLFFIKPSYSKISSSPTKQAELMSMGIPVIVNDRVGDTAELVEKYEAGIVIREFNSETYKRGVEQFVNCSFNPTDIRKGAIEYFGLEKAVDNYSKVYKEILS